VGEERSIWARRLDRVGTRILRAGGWFAGRPNEGLLHELTGRSKGGAPGIREGDGFVAHLEAGRRALETGQSGEALFRFSQAAIARDSDPWPWHGRGDVLQLAGDHVGAEQAYRGSIEREPALALSFNGLGNALKGQGDLGGATQAWERALELDPELTLARQALERSQPSTP
jgi:Flp pilus assembly protein TadD